jgi:hypothetical protein
MFDVCLSGLGEPPLLFCVQLQGLETRGHKSNMPKRQIAPFRHVRLMLVGPERAASAFLCVQLRRLVLRGHKLKRPKRQGAPFRSFHLMLVGPGQAASAFLNILKFPIYDIHLENDW